MTTITWDITQMDCKPQEDGQTDVVITAHWQCVGVETQNENTYTGLVYSSTMFTYTPGTPFTPYNQLTKDQVLNWIWASGVDKAATEIAVQQQIDNEINPPIVVLPLPWAQ